jgi:hypothetical protein
MIKAGAIFCGFLGIIIIALMIASAPPEGDVLAAQPQFSDDGCVTRELALDEGYGVSRKVSQRVCASQN